MIKKLKDRVNSYVDDKFKRLFKKQQKISQIQFNYSQLNQLFSDSPIYIPLTKWAISPSTITHVLNDIIIEDRKCIVEFGSGISTIYIAKLLKSNKINANFFSVESNSDWVQKITKQLELLDLTAYVTIIHAPIQPVKDSISLENQKLWYDLDALNEQLDSIKDIDLVLVDGPFGGITPHARYSAVPFLKDKLAQNYAVFLDDVHRKGEKNIIKSWESTLNCQAKVIERYAILSPNEQFYSKPFQLK